MAFECPHCGAKNNEIQSARAIAERGVVQRCLVDSKRVNIRYLFLDWLTIIKLENSF